MQHPTEAEKAANVISRAKRIVRSALMKRSFYQSAIQERDQAIQERDQAIQERDQAIQERDQAINDLQKVGYRWFAPPGHFYSPLVDVHALDTSSLVDLAAPKDPKVSLPGIELATAQQWALLDQLSKHLTSMPDFSEAGRHRFHFGGRNDQFGYADGTFLYLMLREFEPKRIVEVGSGWTSSLMLDVADEFPSWSPELTFIEPHPERLNSILNDADHSRCRIIVEEVQKVPLEVFSTLREGDLLFIDNSHVSKTGSDVNHLFFNVLPTLPAGVIVHVHDVPYPFEYPKQWIIDDVRNWNEAYVLRAFLANNDAFEIILWQSNLALADPKRLERIAPLATKDLGMSLWLSKTR